MLGRGWASAYAQRPRPSSRSKNFARPLVGQILTNTRPACVLHVIFTLCVGLYMSRTQRLPSLECALRRGGLPAAEAAKGAKSTSRRRSTQPQPADNPLSSRHPGRKPNAPPSQRTRGGLLAQGRHPQDKPISWPMSWGSIGPGRSHSCGTTQVPRVARHSTPLPRRHLAKA